jgi:hypothetical protein
VPGEHQHLKTSAVWSIRRRKPNGCDRRGQRFAGAISDPAASDWCDLSWTKWQPLTADFVRASAPLASGIYRIRRTGIASRLTYIGQTSRTLRERLLALAKGTHAEECPFNDPHTAAPHL